jgi:high-affinity nickel-transport protein
MFEQYLDRRKLTGIYALLIGGNVLAWAWALTQFAGHPALLGTALLAYIFGLRHAVDADHIAAIDNVVRKLMHEGKRPLLVGLFFSLGHSTVVVLATLGVAASATTLQSRFELFRDTGGVIGTSISALSCWRSRSLTW